MPKVYTYLGIILLFHSNEHDPIHVHAVYNGKIVKVCFYMNNGRITVRYFDTDGFDQKKLRELKRFVAVMKYNIVDAWIRFFVYHQPIQPINITARI